MSVVIHTDPFWHNRLLLELDLTNDDLALVEAVRTAHTILMPSPSSLVYFQFSATWSLSGPFIFPFLSVAGNRVP